MMVSGGSTSSRTARGAAGAAATADAAAGALFSLAGAAIAGPTASAGCSVSWRRRSVARYTVRNDVGHLVRLKHATCHWAEYAVVKMGANDRSRNLILLLLVLDLVP